MAQPDPELASRVVAEMRSAGCTVALDDFGAGYANLDLLVDLRPDIVKIDRQLIIDIDHSPRRQAIVDALVAMAERLAFRLVAEGVETLAEAAWHEDAMHRFQQWHDFRIFAFEHFGIDPADVDLDLVAHAQGDFGLDLHAGTGEIQAHCRDFPASMMEDDWSFQSHADVVAFLAVRSIVLTHGPCPLLMSSPAALITPADLTCKAAERRPVPA